MWSLAEEIETRVRRSTQDRIRHLIVREDHGRILMQGAAPSQHVTQLSLHGVLSPPSGYHPRAEITVGSGGDRGRPCPRNRHHTRPRCSPYPPEKRHVQPPSLTS